MHQRIMRLWNTLAAMRGRDRKGWRRVPPEYLAVMAEIRHEADRFVRLTRELPPATASTSSAPKKNGRPRAPALRGLRRERTGHEVRQRGLRPLPIVFIHVEHQRRD